ncbi:DUF3137 domain-containing protein [bacterium]|nr:DUF3137 domain-containing protein [bacterium]
MMKKDLSINRTMAAYRQNFYKVYHSTIVPILRDFESKRKDSLRTLTVITITLLIVIFVLGLNLYDTFIHATTGSELWIIAEYIIVLGLILLVIWLPFYFNNRFIADLKYSCMDNLISLFGKMHWYNETEVIDDMELAASDLFATFNTRYAYDGFAGVYKDVPFEISETEMQHITGSGKRRRVVHIFKGVIVKFQSNKRIMAKTIIATKGDNKIRGGAVVSFWSVMGGILFAVISNIIESGFNIASIIMWLIIGGVVVLGYFIYLGIARVNQKAVLNEIKLEDPEFSKKYRAYSSDQIESRYLITPAFMERFKNIETSFGTHNVKCSFYGNTLMFAISTNKNLFEIGNLYKSLEDPKQLETFFNEITSIFLLVDYFKLNERNTI